MAGPSGWTRWTREWTSGWLMVTPSPSREKLRGDKYQIGSWRSSSGHYTMIRKKHGVYLLRLGDQVVGPIKEIYGVHASFENVIGHRSKYFDATPMTQWKRRWNASVSSNIGISFSMLTRWPNEESNASHNQKPKVVAGKVASKDPCEMRREAIM